MKFTRFILPLPIKINLTHKYFETDSLGNVIDQSLAGLWQSGSFESVKKLYITAGIGFVLGMEIPLSKRFNLGVQLNPTFLYSIGIEEKILQ